MTYHCPNISCLNHLEPKPGFYIKKGYYKTLHNSQKVPRYACKACGKKFSSASFKDTYRQHKPALNQPVFEVYCSGVTQRRLALLLRCNRKTVVRKFRILSDKARQVHSALVFNGDLKTDKVIFDEMETYEHTKLKPLSVPLAVCGRTGKILDIGVASMNCKGHLASRSQELYGPRIDDRMKVGADILKTVKYAAGENITIFTDAKPAYVTLVKGVLPKATHRPQVAARQENKPKDEWNDLWWLNHMAARIRSDLSRMSRKTWVTTKKPKELWRHLYLFIAYVNGYALT